MNHTWIVHESHMNRVPFAYILVVSSDCLTFAKTHLNYLKTFLSSEKHLNYLKTFLSSEKHPIYFFRCYRFYFSNPQCFMSSEIPHLFLSAKNIVEKMFSHKRLTLLFCYLCNKHFLPCVTTMPSTIHATLLSTLAAWKQIILLII